MATEATKASVDRGWFAICPHCYSACFLNFIGKTAKAILTSVIGNIDARTAIEMAVDSLDDRASTLQGELAQPLTATDHARSTLHSELLVADASCPHIRELLVGCQASVLWLQGDQDPFLAISQALADRAHQGAPIQTLHWVSHGSPGQPHIGDRSITTAALIAHAQQLKNWGVKDLAIWSCSVGSDPTFISVLEELSGARVWASDQPLGRLDRNTSHWQLSSRHSGSKRQPALPIHRDKQNAWPHQLGDFTTYTDIAPASPGRTVRESRNTEAFAALKDDGSVITWGNDSKGGDSSDVASDLTSGVSQIFSTNSAFAALKDDGSVITWGVSDSGGNSSDVASDLSSGVSQIFSTNSAFAAVKDDGSVITWGDADSGGDSSAVSSSLASGVSQIFSTNSAFAAVKDDGSVITWGDADSGGDSSAVSSSLASGVSQIFSTNSAFAAVKDDGSVITWGSSFSGGNSSDVASDLTSGVSQIFSTNRAFAALKDDGSVITWGAKYQGGNSSDVASELSSGVSQIFSTNRAFAALKDDGSVINWGNYYGNSSDAASYLTSGVSQIFSLQQAFAALKNGAVVTWGLSDSDLSLMVDVAADLTSGVSQIFTSDRAFAALKEDGSVITWGDSSKGGDSSDVASDLTSGVSQIFSTNSAFAALKDDGSVITWGDGASGGNSSAVASSLASGVVGFANPFANDVYDSTAPTFSSAITSTDGSKVVLTYDETLSSTTAATTDFAVTTDGASNAVTTVAISGSTVELTLTNTVNNDDTVTVAYTDPTSGNDANAIQDSVSNEAASLSSTSVDVSNIPNRAPTLDASVSPLFAAIDANTGVPSGAVGTLVSALIDSGGSLDNFADADGGSPAIVIIGTNLNGGTLYYSIDNGNNWSDVGTVSEASARVLYGDSNTRLAFKPATDYIGTISDLITFKAWDRSGPTSISSTPTLTGTLDTASYAYGVTLSADGNTAFVADYTSGLQIIDVSNPASPTLTTTLDTSGYAYGVTLSADSNTAFVADGSSGLRIIDVSNPASPTLTATLGTSDSAFDVALSADSNTAFVADYRSGLQIIDVSDPASPTLRGNFNTQGIAYVVTLSADGNTAFVADESRGLQIIDVSNPASPTLTANFDTAGRAYDVTLSADGNTAFVADGGSGLQIIDISTLASPTLTATLDTSKLARSVTLSADGNTAFVSDEGALLTIIDVSNPASPSLTATLGTNAGALDITLSADGNTAFVADSDFGLRIIDVADPIANGSSGIATATQFFSSNSDIASIQIAVPAPTLTSATYDASSASIVVTGTNLVAKSGALNDIDISQLSITGEGSSSYTFTTSDIEIDSATQFTLSLNTADSLQLAGLLNKNGTASGGGTTYNLAAASSWNPGASSSPADSSGNAITVSNVAAPTISSAAYNDATGILSVTGINLPAYPGASNDIDVSKLTITGESGGTYSLSSTDVELASATEFVVTLNSTDQTNLDSILNKNGASSSLGTTYNIAAADRWAPGSDASSVSSADLTSNAVTVTNIPNRAPSGLVTISGTATEGETLTAANTLSDADGLGTIAYGWNRAGSTITGATASTYSLVQADVGSAISVTASYTDGEGTAESVSSSATSAVANVNDAPTGSVTISGTATEGETLTAANTLSDADGLGTIAYGWNRAGPTITGATASTYTLGQVDVGSAISVTASYTDGEGTAESVSSTATSAVANVNDAPTGSVTISGTATQGETLTAANTLADVDGLGSIGYQWNRDGAEIFGATSSTYLLGRADVGSAITVTANYTDGEGKAESVTSISATPMVASRIYQLSSSDTVDGIANSGIIVKNKRGKTFSDTSSSRWDVVKAVQDGSNQWKVLLIGINSYEGKWYYWNVDETGVITSGSGWKNTADAENAGWDKIFGNIFNPNIDTSLSVLDNNSNGIVDDLTNYHLTDGSTSVRLHSTDLQSYSHESSANWDVSKAVEVNGAWKVLVKGANSMDGMWSVWDAGVSGTVTQASTWMSTADSLKEGWEQIFGDVIQVDDVIGPVENRNDLNSDGLMDNMVIYHLDNGENGDGIAIHNSRGNTYSDASTSRWDAVLVVEDNNNDWKVLLQGTGSYDGKWYYWNVDDTGLITSGSGWKSYQGAIDDGWQSFFGDNLNGFNDNQLIIEDPNMIAS